MMHPENCECSLCKKYCKPKPLLDDLDHPCRETCSGWQQGYERGAAELARSKSYQDVLTSTQTLLADAKAEIRSLQFANQKLREALEKMQHLPYPAGKWASEALTSNFETMSDWAKQSTETNSNKRK